MKDFPSDIIKKASELTEASKTIDYRRIVAHDKAEVSKLNLVLKQLRIKPTKAPETLEGFLGKKGEPEKRVSGASAAEVRRKEMVETLKEDFSDRINKVYNSFSIDRNTDIKLVPHRKGLPTFDLVVAPDFSPVAGMHGIFVTEDKVMSILLPSDAGSSSQWHVFKERAFTSMDEMSELVTLMAAGFDLP